jgi:hypothetical protein
MEAFADAAVDLTSIDSGRIVLRHADCARSFRLHQRVRPLRPSEVSAPLTTDALLVAPSVTASVEARLRQLGWSWVTDDGRLHLRFGDHVVDNAGPSPSPRIESQAMNLPARGTGTFAVLRRLLVRPHWRQVQLAEASGLTQARVSQVLAGLSDAGLVARDSDGWAVTDWERALQIWLLSYPGPRGVTTYWSGIDDVWSNTLSALDGLPDQAAVSGDVAADLLAPWRQPRSATIYVSAINNLAGTGLVQVTARDEGTVAVCVPRDRSVWPLEPIDRTFRDRKIHVADPFQVLNDIVSADGEDSASAAERLTTWIRHEYNGGIDHG